MKNEIEKIKEVIEQKSSIQDLRKTAKLLNLKLKRTMKKKDIIKLIRSYLNESNVSSSEKETSKKPKEENKKQEVSKTIKDLPKSYKKDYIVLDYVSPYWVHLRWDFCENTINLFKSLNFPVHARIVDVTNIIYDGSNGNRLYEKIVSPETGTYYFNVENPEANYIGEIGYYINDKFSCLLKSNIIKTPSNSPKKRNHEKWVILKNKNWKDLNKEKIEESEKLQESNLTIDSELSFEYLNPSSGEHIKKLSKIKSGGLI